MRFKMGIGYLFGGCRNIGASYTPVEMFKAGRWRSDKSKSKSKITAVFELQLKVTQVPEKGWETMKVTMVPIELGKAARRSEKAAVIAGECNWQPIYETVKLTHDPKTGKHGERVYQFIVSASGRSKSEQVGEITINFADCAPLFKPTSGYFSKTSSTGAVIHMTLQRIQNDGDGRDVDDGNGDAASQRNRLTLQSQLSNCDVKEINSTEANINDKLRKCISLDMMSASGSETSSEQFTPTGNDIKNSDVSRDSVGSVSHVFNRAAPQKPMTQSNDSVSLGSAPNGSTGGSINNSGDSVDKLRPDLALKRQLEVADLEVQTLRKQVVKESKRAQELQKELSTVKDERDTLRKECEEIKVASQNQKVSDGEGSWWSLQEELRRELSHEKNLSTNLRLQLQKTQDANSELILAVRDLEEMLEQKNSETSCASCSTKNSETSCVSCSTTTTKPDPNREFKEPEVGSELSPHGNSLENGEQFAVDVLVKEPYGIKAATSLEQQIIDLTAMVELYKRYHEDTEMQLEQLALDYEILKQENHDMSVKLDQVKLQEQLRLQYECSSHSAIINDLEAQVESLEKELDSKAKVFEADLETVMNAKVEQEQRAIRAEEEVRKTRLNTANTAEHLQEEFKTLTEKISSTFYVNEKLLMQAQAENSELHSQKSHLEELLKRTNKELASVKGQCCVKFRQLLSLLELKTKEVDRLSQELKDKQDSSEETMVVKAEMEKLSTEKIFLAKQIGNTEKLVAEVEEMKILIEKTKKLMQERETERNILQIELASLKEDAYTSAEEIYNLKHALDEKETMIDKINSEKECLGDKITMKVSNDEEYIMQTRMEDKACKYCTGDIDRELNTRNRGANAEEEEEGQSASCTCNQRKIDEVLAEMALLKKRNQSVEAELKDMQERYSNISLKFAEVEGERQQLVMTVRTLRNANKN